MMLVPRLARFSLVLGAALLAGSCTKQSETIKVGEYASMTGKEATYGQASHKGTLLAVEEINAAGGILGKKLELITEDNQSKAGESVTIVKKFISRDKVVAVLGEVASSRSLEAAPVCQNAKIPMITPSSTSPKVTEAGDYIFRVCFIDPFQGTVMAKFAKDTLKLRKVALLTSVSNAYSVGLAKYFKERFAADGGAVALEQKYAEGEKDFRAQLTAIKAANVEGIFVPGYYAEAALICKQAQDLGLKIPLFGADGWESPELVEIGGKAVEGSYFATHYSPENQDANVVAFNDRFRKRWGDVSDTLTGLGYDSVMMLADALKRAGTTEGGKLRDALAATKNFHGVTGTITLDAQRNPTKSAVVLTVKDGKFVFVTSIAP
ncbi:MAG TPA: ABC transporter substrate-binding protein [Opitutaceae bacterium]|nr:ABC transporter substrate-binding protein [Opitutaceae bacterium]